MQWGLVEQYIQGDPSDLFEVYFYDLDPHSWGRLFAWIRGKVSLLDCQFGRLGVDELDLDQFLNGNMFYIAHIKTSDEFELSLSIIEEKELTIDIEKCEIDTEEKFTRFLRHIIDIAKLIECNNYIICPEFKTDNAFIINGVLV